MTTEALATPSPLGSPAVRAIAPFLEARTWGALAYVWLGFPLGLAWFVGLTVGIATGAALTIVWIGIVLLFVTFLAAWGAEGLERRLAIWLLGAKVAERRPRPEGPESFRAWAKSVFTRAPLWKGLLFLALRFPLGLAGWIVSVVSLAVSVIGLLLLIVTFHLHRAMGWAWARLAELLLGGDAPQPASGGLDAAPAAA